MYYGRNIIGNKDNIPRGQVEDIMSEENKGKT